jgi:hypothetical protein
MNPEIEKFIDLAIADGQITEKERNVILKKAVELGIDADEVEMVLDGRLHQLEANKPKQKEKVGNIKTCPACGASINSFELDCPKCNQEFTNISANKITLSFENEVKKRRKEYIENGLKIGESNTLLEIHFEQKELPLIIKNFPVPNSKEDLLEILSFMSSKVISSTDYENEEINAYQAKALEIITKLHFIPNIDPIILDRIKEIELKMKNVKAKNARSLWLIITFCFSFIYLMIALFGRLFGAHLWPF